MISAIIPVYNGEKHLPNLMRDLWQQSSKDFEVIFVNDGSTDRTSELLTFAQSSAPFNITVVNQTNQGVSAARNAGIERSRGEYLTFIDADDGIAPDYFRFIHEAVSADPCDLFFFQMTRQRKNFSREMNSLSAIEPQAALRSFLWRKVSFGIWSVAIKHELIKQNDLRFEKGYNYGEDIHMLWRLLTFAKSIRLSEIKLYLYEFNTSSAMHHFNSDRLHAVELIKQLETFFKERDGLFYPSFKRYAVARTYWALLWQAALFLPYDKFRTFSKEHHITRQFQKLVFSSHELKVAVSSLIEILCPRLFYFLARKYGRHKTFPPT